MALRDRMKADWHEMTVMEKKAGTLFLYLYNSELRSTLAPTKALLEHV